MRERVGTIDPGRELYVNASEAPRDGMQPIFLDGSPVITIPNGATGYFGRLSFGGKLIENRLCETTWDAEGNVQEGCGEYDADFTINAGSYYDKAWTAYLMTESEDNFISDSRTDFTDGRYRAVSMADVFPDGFRRWLGSYLTGDIDSTALYVAGVSGSIADGVELARATIASGDARAKLEHFVAVTQRV